MSVAENTILLLIDPQNDFHSGGSLAVAGKLVINSWFLFV